MNRESKPGKSIELGEIEGAIPVKLGSRLPILLLVTSKALVLASIKPELLKLVFASSIYRLKEIRGLVELSKKKKEELINYIRENMDKVKVYGIIPRNMITYIELTKGFFGLAGVKLVIHTSDDKKVSLDLIYGTATGFSKEEAVKHTIEKLQILNVRIEKKI